MPTERMTIAIIAELTKWKLSLAVAFSAVTGYLIFDGGIAGTGLSESAIDTALIMVATGVFFLSAGAAALNQYTERKSDALMERTAGRPLPSGRMAAPAALVVAVAVLAAGIVLLARGGTWPVLLGALNVILYNLIYTGLKRRTTLAIIPGALVGAVPPLIGYTAAGGAMTDSRILLFALFMFLWQMPHFWLLLIRYGEEYEKAGIKTIHSLMGEASIMRLVMGWITGSSLLLWLLTAIYMPFSSTAAIILFLLNAAFIIAFAGIIRAGFDGVRSKYAFIAFNSFSAVVMIILIAFA